MVLVGDIFRVVSFGLDIIALLVMLRLAIERTKALLRRQARSDSLSILCINIAFSLAVTQNAFNTLARVGKPMQFYGAWLSILWVGIGIYGVLQRNRLLAQKRAQRANSGG